MAAQSGGAWLLRFLYDHGLRGETLKRMWAIGMRESGGRPNVDNAGLNSDGSVDYGLFQINDKAHAAAIKQKFGWSMEDLKDPEKNVQVMMWMSNKGQNLSAWGVSNPDGSVTGWAKNIGDAKRKQFEAAMASKYGEYDRLVKRTKIDVNAGASALTPDGSPRDMTAGSVDGLSKAELSKDFGQSYGVGLILSNPELMLIAYKSQGWTNARIDPKTGKIVKGKNTGVEWDETTTGAAIQQTQWYNTRTGNQREAENAEKMDPTSFNARVRNLVANIEQSATEMGADIAGVDVDSFAREMLRDNWNYLSGSADAQVPDRLLKAFLTPYIKAGADGQYRGQAATTAASLRQTASAYGVRMSDSWIAKGVQQINDGTTTEQDLLNEIVANSKSRYAGFGNMISDTRSLQDIADQYVQSYANIWDQDASTIDLFNPDIQAALQYTDPATGQVRPRSLYEFEMDQRQKPGWIGTKQGRQEMRAGSMEMLKSFGFWK